MSVGRQPGQGKYARSERERRWLVPSMPAAAGRPCRIADRYLLGTTLRLRRVEDATAVAYKLGQKIRVVPGDPFLVRVTNLYLTAQEYQRLAVLPAAVLDKTRWLAPHGSAVFAVDEFHGPLRGLLLAEIELAEVELTEAGLTEAGLTGAGLTEAGLTEAGLTEAELTEAGLTERPAVGTALAEGLLADLPPWLGLEVTSDDRYSGAALARAGRAPRQHR